MRMQLNIGNLNNKQLAKLKKDAEKVLNITITDFEWQRCVQRLRIVESRRDITIDATAVNLLVKALESE